MANGDVSCPRHESTDDCWGVVLRAELLRADWALRRLPANTAAQHDAQKNCRRHLAWEPRPMDWMWLRLTGAVSEDHGMLEAACAAEQDLHDSEGTWQHDGNSGLAAAYRRLTVAAAGTGTFSTPNSVAAGTFGSLADDLLGLIGTRLLGGQHGITRRAVAAADVINAICRRAHAYA